MPRMYDDIIIDLHIDEPSRSSPALGHIDKLLRQSALETQSLQVVRRMMMRDLLDRAQVTGVTKLKAAAKQRQSLLPGIIEHNGQDIDAHKPHRYAPRQSSTARLAAIQTYLENHPGGTPTQVIAAALGWPTHQVLKFAKRVGKGKREGGTASPLIWFPKTKIKTKTKTTERAESATAPARSNRQPRTQRQDAIREFLTKHPNAYTREIAQALNTRPNSNFVKIIREVAQPSHPTLGTQPIQWQLTA